MFNFIQSASDDQTAIGACVLTLLGAAVLVFATFHLGPAGKKLKKIQQDKSKVIAHPQILTESDRSHERAA